MTMNKLCLVAMTICLLTQAASAQTHNQNSDSTPYAGFEDREIKSLSDADIDELRMTSKVGGEPQLPDQDDEKPLNIIAHRRCHDHCHSCGRAVE